MYKEITMCNLHGIVYILPKIIRPLTIDKNCLLTFDGNKFYTFNFINTNLKRFISKNTFRCYRKKRKMITKRFLEKELASNRYEGA